jgi:hypothetical protein
MNEQPTKRRRRLTREQTFALLPRQTKHGFIMYAFPPHPYEVRNARNPNAEYQACCLDPREWHGKGKWRAVEPSEPFSYKGRFRWARDLECSCGQRIFGSEYSPDAGEKKRPPTAAKQIRKMPYGSSEQRAAADAWYRRFAQFAERHPIIAEAVWDTIHHNDVFYTARQRWLFSQPEPEEATP